MNYIKKETKAVVEAVKSRGKWQLTHKDGNVTFLSDAKFSKRYDPVKEEKKDADAK